MQVMLKYQNQKSKPLWKKREKRLEPTHYPSLWCQSFWPAVQVLALPSNSIYGSTPYTPKKKKKKKKNQLSKAN